MIFDVPNDVFTPPNKSGLSEHNSGNASIPDGETLTLAIGETYTFPSGRVRSLAYKVKLGKVDVSYDGGVTWPKQLDGTDQGEIFGQGNDNLVVQDQIIIRATTQAIVQVHYDRV